MIRLALLIFILCSFGLLVNAGNKVFSSCDLCWYGQSGSSSDYNEIELAIPSGDIIETTKSEPSFITDLKKDCLLTSRFIKRSDQLTYCSGNLGFPFIIQENEYFFSVFRIQSGRSVCRFRGNYLFMDKQLKYRHCALFNNWNQVDSANWIRWDQCLCRFLSKE